MILTSVNVIETIVDLTIKLKINHEVEKNVCYLRVHFRIDLHGLKLRWRQEKHFRNILWTFTKACSQSSSIDLNSNKMKLFKRRLTLMFRKLLKICSHRLPATCILCSMLLQFFLRLETMSCVVKSGEETI